MRDLVLLALWECDRIISDDTGRVASQLRARYGIPDSTNNAKYISVVLKRLADEGIIRRMTDEARKRTFSIELLVMLDQERVAELTAGKESNVAKFLGVKPMDEAAEADAPVDDFDELVELCERAYNAVLRATEVARREGDFVALSVGATLGTVDIRGDAAKRARYYLRELGLTKSSAKVGGGSNLYWWLVKTDGLNHDLLRELAAKRSYEWWVATHGGKAVAGPVTVRRVEVTPAAKPTPAILDRRRAASSPSATSPERDPMEAVIDLAERQAGELEGERRKSAALEKQIRTERIAHANEVAGLKAQITALEAQLGTHGPLARRAAELLARVAGGADPVS